MVTPVNLGCQHPDKRKLPFILVFGISGATWSVVNPLLSRGRLPNIRMLKKEGSWGTLASVKVSDDKHYRPQVAWPTVSSGVLPERHGMTKFYNTSEDLRVPCIWDHFMQGGFRVGLYGWPMTWPPSQVDGFVVPCHHARDSQTWPPELRIIKDISRDQKNSEREGPPLSFLRSVPAIARILFKHSPPMNPLMRLIHTSFKIIRTRDLEIRSFLLRRAKFYLDIAVFLSLLKNYNPHLAMFNTFLVDFTSHRYWQYFEPEKFSDSQKNPILQSALENAYDYIDKTIGWLVKLLPPNTILTVLSEHGMSPEIISGEVGRYRYIIRANQLKKLANLEKDILLIPIARWIAIRRRSGQSIGEETIKQLRSVYVLETGLPLFNVHSSNNKEVVVKFNINSKISLYKKGDLESLHISIGKRVVPFLELACKFGARRSAMHARDGIFLIKGPNIRPEFEVVGAEVIDIMPTLLSSSGVHVPSGLDGKILDVFV